MDAVIVATRLRTLEFDARALGRRFGLENGDADDGDGGSLVLLALAAAQAFPDHADDAVAGVPDFEGVEAVRDVS
jgi:hypothetical protein